MGASEYVNLHGGQNLYSKSEFDNRGLTLPLRAPLAMKYETFGYQFEDSLSILDVLMWNSPSAVLEFLNSGNKTKESA